MEGAQEQKPVKGQTWLWVWLIVLLIIVAYAVIFFSANAGRTAEKAWVFWGVERAWIWALVIAAVVGLIAVPIVRALFSALRRLSKDREGQEMERRPQ